MRSTGWIVRPSNAFAAKLGFSLAIVPKANAPKGASRGVAAKAFEGLTIHPVERIEEAIDLVRTL